MKLKFLIVSSRISQLSQDLIDEILIKGHTFAFSTTQDFIFEIENGHFKASTPNIPNLFDFDIYILRSFSKNMANSKIFTEELRLKNKIVIEECISDNYINSKFAEGVRLTRSGLNYPISYQIPNIENIEKIPDNIFPAIVKPTNGSRGRNISIIENKKDLANFIQKNPEDLLVQEYLPIEWDIRIFVVGNKVLGGIKRYVLEGDCRSNASLGSQTEPFEVTSEIEEIALRATKTLHYSVAGVDLAWAKNKQNWFVIEVNISPQWHAFKAITKINPAIHIIQHAIDLYVKKNAQK